ncbi:cobalt-precorrin-5B (C(1))-methyltransferase CbiD [Alkaliphilus peptidifermentans]|uniref:Cobalt-precorrin-5B C(1)-methyltransferase n=1 Tax=Alkaliphilus peptidifermentans DSM 18978 TaxID=1120976 RepID=A0A1G5AQS0_9FIRM|nr:cobalt-precorrin-5B (C(1))-methyltransferase CbiD [Alkaliphilus peptidifermentans]SCX80225.1 cobalt-precorrin 5B C1-methyltransferase [Alkaliphilus peptidifermentans DSM 18978]
MLNKYVMKNGKKLRYGYTTGSCAAAASKAAAQILLSQHSINNIEIDTPKGWRLMLPVKDIVFDKEKASCSIIKDGGDDPDATTGLSIYSQIKWRRDNIISIDGGIGVGRVTKKGLPIEVGRAAINPIPLRMIEAEVRQVIGEHRGANIEISVPKGAVIAEKTFNPRMGIIGGISILGTSGIVEPMSEEAFKESLSIEMNLLIEDGITKLVMVPGNYGRDLALDKLHIDNKYIFKFSNFIGYILDDALDKKIEKILLIGHIGKIIKVAGGIFHTHSKVADGRLEILTAHLALMGAAPSELEVIMNSNTTEEAVEWVKKYGYEEVFTVLAKKITEKSIQRTYGEIQIGTIIFSMEEGILGICPSGKILMEEFKHE